MKLYIKENLKSIPIINQLYNIVRAYGLAYGGEEEQDSMEDYKYYLKNDYVQRFIDYVVLDDGSDAEVRKNKIIYLTSLFYCVKGTYKVLDYMIDYSLVDAEITYTTKDITIAITTIPESLDRDLFCTYLEKFLSALLYFESLNITISSLSVSVMDNTVAALNYGKAFYQSYEAREEEE